MSGCAKTIHICKISKPLTDCLHVLHTLPRVLPCACSIPWHIYPHMPPLLCGTYLCPAVHISAVHMLRTGNMYNYYHFYMPLVLGSTCFVREQTQSTLLHLKHLQASCSKKRNVRLSCVREIQGKHVISEKLEVYGLRNLR